MLCGSALAEAEVEYQDKTSLAIDVKFGAVNPDDFLSRMVKKVAEIYPVSVPIWTTTLRWKRRPDLRRLLDKRSLPIVRTKMSFKPPI